MQIELPNDAVKLAELQAQAGGFADVSDYLRRLIRRDCSRGSSQDTMTAEQKDASRVFLHKEMKSFIGRRHGNARFGIVVRRFQAVHR